jgi:predicted TIM-barrel fold metal-dependent hydrolase
MIVDTHVHILDRGFWPDEWFDWVALQWASRKPERDPSTIRPKIEDGLLDPQGDRLVADMDAAGVAVSVNLPMDWGPDFAERVPMEEVNRHSLAVAERHPGRIIPFVGIDPRRPGAAGQIERALRDDGAKGLKLYPPAGWDPFTPEVRPIYELAIEYGVPVLWHTGEALPKLRVRYGDPILLQDVHAAYPELITWIGHAGAKIWWDQALSVAAHSINSYLETSVWIWDDTPEAEQHAFIRRLAQARERIGIERIIFGSDHLAGPRIRAAGFLDKVVGWYRNLPVQAAELGISFTQAEVDAILGGNAAQILGLPAASAVDQATEAQ